MLDSLTSLNHRDFSARYNGTFGWYIKDDHQKVLTLITEVDPTRVAFQDVKGTAYYAYANKGSQFEFLPVTRGWFYGKSDNMYLLSRRAARQWHRGICANNTIIYLVRHGDTGMRQVDVEITRLDDIFNHPGKQYRHLKDINCILSKQFAIVQNNLYLYDRVIGKRTQSVLQLNDGAEILKQEIQDVIQRNNYPLTLKEA